MKNILNFFSEKMFGRRLDFRIRLFNIMSISAATIGISTVVFGLLNNAGTVNLLTGVVSTLFSLSILYYSIRTRRYQLCYTVTIVVIFFIFYPLFFFSAGGYLSGMPIAFVLAILITIIMLQKTKALVIAGIEMIFYVFLCLIAKQYPHTVDWFANETLILQDIIWMFVAVSTTLGFILFMHLRLYNQQQDDLEKARKAAQASSEAKSRFLANMSHEIRTPINSIMGFTELALDYASPSKVREYLSKICDSTELLMFIVNDILDITKIESGKMELENIPFDLYGIFMRCQSIISPRISEKGLDLRIHAEPLYGKKLSGDPLRLYQALMNLLSNAVKFTNSGSVSMSASIAAADSGSVTILFEVKDSGIGINPEHITKIFEPFTQADSSTTRNYGGTGLGLSITKNLVELMGGVLSVDSTPGMGTAFSFELRFGTIDAPDEKTEHAETGVIEKPYFSGLVLVCEDNLMNQQLMCEHLERVGLKSLVAENGQIGLRMAEERIQKKTSPL